MRERNETHEAFEGLPREEYGEIIANEPPAIYESFSIDREMNTASAFAW